MTRPHHPIFLCLGEEKEHGSRDLAKCFTNGPAGETGHPPGRPGPAAGPSSLLAARPGSGPQPPGNPEFPQIVTTSLGISVTPDGKRPRPQRHLLAGPGEEFTPSVEAVARVPSGTGGLGT